MREHPPIQKRCSSENFDWEQTSFRNPLNIDLGLCELMNLNAKIKHNFPYLGFPNLEIKNILNEKF